MRQGPTMHYEEHPEAVGSERLVSVPALLLAAALIAVAVLLMGCSVTIGATAHYPWGKQPTTHTGVAEPSPSPSPEGGK